MFEGENESECECGYEYECECECECVKVKVKVRVKVILPEEVVYSYLAITSTSRDIQEKAVRRFSNAHRISAQRH
jgi:hypothetical protein